MRALVLPTGTVSAEAALAPDRMRRPGAPMPAAAAAEVVGLVTSAAMR